MTRETTLLRVLAVLFLAWLGVAAALVYIVSLDFAATYPQVAHLRMPVYLAFLIGLVPVVVGIRVVFALLRVVDQGDAFSTHTLRGLRQLKVLAAITAAYEVLGIVGIWVGAWVSTGQTKAYFLLPWLAAEVVTLFLFTLVALLERLFAAALELRQDTELTV